MVQVSATKKIAIQNSKEPKLNTIHGSRTRTRNLNHRKSNLASIASIIGGNSKKIMLTTFITRHVRRYMEKNEETIMEEKVKLKINGGLRNTYLKLLCSHTT